MTDEELVPAHAATVELIERGTNAAIRAVIGFRKEFGRLPDDRERRLIVDAVVDHFSADMRPNIEAAIGELANG